MNDVYRLWCEKVEDQELKDELKSLEGNDAEIENRFYKDIEFGTAGLRGIIGAGINCLNVYTIKRTTLGVANYIKLIRGRSAAISYDSRIKSELFAKTAAAVLAGQGIKVYLVKELMPTPFVSYATRYFKCDIGIMITASHNPAKYNGYKVYGCDGCQVTEEAAKKISDEIGRIDCFSIQTNSFESYLKSGLIEYIGDAVTDSYLERVKHNSVCPIEGLKIVYTPLNGTGFRIIPRLLKERGVKDLTIVESQALPDGNFPTCPYPNPEKREALAEGLKVMKAARGDILLATDPDADRIGIAIRHGDDYCLMTGNEVGALLADFLLSMKKASGKLPKNPVIVKTIVSTNLVTEIAKSYGATVINVLTGFKYIGEQIGILEKKGEEDRFILGFEESYGYLVGTAVRDKDSVVAVQMIAEMASHYKKQGKTLIDVLNGLYEKFGTYEHHVVSHQFEGAKGSAEMKQRMLQLREQPLKEIGGYNICSQKDYLKDNGDGLPKSDVMSYELDCGAQVIMRPSGTEPLMKAYITVNKTKEENEKTSGRIIRFLNEFLK